MGFRFEKLDIWNDAINYVNKIYSLTKNFPRDELFGLKDQLRRSASSISANIAEGSGSSSKRDFSNYLNISIKSIYETVSHLHIARSQNYIPENKRTELYNEAEVLVKRIQSFRKWLNANHKP
ncbi:MAG: four helix bundle protein [Patescibacteria group bacterium]